MASPRSPRGADGRSSLPETELYDMDDIPQSPGMPYPRQSAFFIGLDTPDNVNGQKQLHRQVTVGGQSDHQIDYIQDTPPKLAITLISKYLLMNVFATCLFLIVFTIVAYYGIVIDTFTEEVGSTSTKAADQVELYNTISGFILAFVEVCLGLFMFNFLPAFMVYLHNWLWFLHRNETYMKFSAALRSTMMFIFPVLIMLLIGNSLRSMQAAQSTVGFETIILMDDLRSELPVIQTIKAEIMNNANKTMSAEALKNLTAKSLGMGTLKNAVEGTSIPFAVRKSLCSKSSERPSKDFQLSPHDLDSTNVVFGFKASEWNSEALDESLDADVSLVYKYPRVHALIEKNASVKQPTDFDMHLAFEMFGQAKVLLDKSLADTDDNYVACTTYKSVSGALLKRRLQSDSSDVEGETSSSETRDGSESETDTEVDEGDSGSKLDDEEVSKKCDTVHSTLTQIGDFLKDSKKATVQNLMTVVADGIEQTITGVNKTSTSITLKSYKINSQIKLETMQIDVSVAIPDSEFFTVKEEGHRIYEYENWGAEFCGSSNCLFLDINGTRRVPRQVVLMPYQSNCSFSSEDLSYSSDLRGFFPSKCNAQSNSVMAFSTSTYITADEYGSDITKYDPGMTSGTAYLVNPRRWIRLVVTKLTWQSKNLAHDFDIECRREGAACTGITYRLPRTGRYVFTGEDALPTHRLIEDKVSLVAPLRLLQVNEATMFIDEFQKQVIPERLEWRNMPSTVFKKTRWTKNALKGGQCSMLIDSYINYVTDNQYYLDRPYSTVYRAAFAYVFSNGSVTELNDTSIFVNNTNQALTNLTSFLSKDSLGNLKLKGDVIQRDIRVLVPSSSFKATMIGCGLLVLFALIVVAIPMRRVEFFTHGVSKAEEFIVMSKNEKYPDLVHQKTFFFPESGQSLPMSDFYVEEMTLRHRVFPEQELRF
ncbi:hypothetical protein Poli38472_012408 [Pythium oligandrum]|uniref:Uncharacterized protein n=1 Tax=Pythium oligandrum TaxID=41045 RepID=A0A8K1FPV4_PYTOL|nr:hypothetical protein Poli38472_012408 [Pythium oligandrum]|eukprot:TMW67292.1 hypothetical protein Poli38472_012408 [Pythium oligandrum]